MRARLLVILALALTVALPASAQVKQQELAGVQRYSRVDATVGCGGQTDPSAMAALKKEGYVAVINLRMATEQGAQIEESRAAAQNAGLKYIHLPFDGASPDPKIVSAFLDAVADKRNQPVYIHCGTANRVGAVWMIKRALQDGWPLEKAQAEGEAIGLQNPRLKEFAATYIKEHSPRR
jgi:uncharacterized protein (TIGR01244 family)